MIREKSRGLFGLISNEFIEEIRYVQNELFCINAVNKTDGER